MTSALKLVVAVGVAVAAFNSAGAESEALTPPDGNEWHEALARAVVFRQEGVYECALIELRTLLERGVPDEIGERIRDEIEALELLLQGWHSKEDREFEIALAVFNRGFHSMDPSRYGEFVKGLIAAKPERWEAHALVARHQLRAGDLGASTASIETACHLGGRDAVLATQPLARELEHRRSLSTAGVTARQHLKAGNNRKAADVLEAAWEADSTLVEYGVKACQLRMRNRDFEDGAGLASRIALYLEKLPEHPLAHLAPAMKELSGQARETDTLRDTVVAKKRAGQSVVVPKGRSASQPSERPADRFKRLTR